MEFIKQNFYKILLASLTSVVAFKLVEFIIKITTFPYQNELREGAPLSVYPLISQGGDPYMMENLPKYMDAYGIIYNLFTVPFANILGNDINTYRFFSLFCYIATLGLIYLALKKLALSKIQIILGLLTYVSFTLSMDFALAVRPDGLGLLLFLGSIIIPYYLNYNKVSIILSVLLSLLAFYTKLYYAFGIFYLAIHIFIFNSKLKGFITGFSGAFALGISILLIRKVSDLYFAITYSANANVGGVDYFYMINQFKAYAIYNWPLILVFLWLGIILIYRIRKFLSFKSAKKFFVENLNFKSLTKPLFNLNIPPYILALFVSIAIVYIRLGRGTGTYLTYYFQLISPFLILTIFYLFSKANFQKRFFELFIIGILIFGIVFNLKRLDAPRSDSNFKRIENLLSSDSKVLASPSMASILVDKNIDIVDSGQTEYFEFSSYSNFFIQTKAKEYKESINENIENQFYDYIIISPDGSNFAKNDLVDDHYKISESLTLEMPWADGQGQGWDLNIWVRK